MKKRVWILLPVLLALLLTGCGCDHEWIPADCLNPQTCAKCGETGEAALGHNWSAATCSLPQTCSRCNETQGEILEHSFGEWSFGDTEMAHSCTGCGLTETAELDRALQLETLLSGLWEFTGLFQEESFYSAYNFSVPGDCLTFGSGRNITGMIDQKAFSATWEFLEYREEEEDRLYYFKATSEDDRAIQMLYRCEPEDETLYCFFADNVQTLLSRNDTTASAIVGTWGAKGAGGMYSLTFHEDRTVTGNLGEAFEGTWQILPIQEVNNDFFQYRFCGFFITYPKDGVQQHLMATAYPPESYSNDPTPEAFTAETISIKLDGIKLTFEAMTQEEIDIQAKAMEEGPNMLVGTWSSMYYRSFHTNPGSDTLALDYTVTFLSDGTFTASVGKEISGTWMYHDSWGDESHGRHSYYFYIQGDVYPCNMELEYTESHVPQLSIAGRSTVPGSGYTLYLNKRSSQQDQIARSLIGSWTSMYEKTRTGDDYQRINTIDYSLVFHEDGTFTGNDGTDLKGIWVYERTRNETVHQYDLYRIGQTERYASVTMYDHSESGEQPEIEWMQNVKDGSRYIRMISYTSEELEAARLGPTYILGEWTSNSDGYSITFHENGTFTANLADTIQGTWSFYRYKPGSAYWYSFAYPGQGEYGDKTLYAHTNDGRLTFRITDGENETFYEMYRSE